MVACCFLVLEVRDGSDAEGASIVAALTAEQNVIEVLTLVDDGSWKHGQHGATPASFARIGNVVELADDLTPLGR